MRAAGHAVRRLAVLSIVVAAAAIGPAAAAAGDPPTLDARSWLLVDVRDGTRIAGNDARQRLPIASATKLMTAYVVLQRLPLDKKVEAAEYAAAPAEIVLGLQPGERLTVRDLLTAMLVQSANDAAVTLAEATSGSASRFVGAMNQAARKLGLSDTEYANPIGLDAPGQLSSARDLADLTLELAKNKVFRKIVALREAQLRSGAKQRDIKTRNTLLNKVQWADGVKTGRTNSAGFVLVGSGTRGGVSLVSVVLGAPSEGARDAESRRLLEYGFSLYEERAAILAGQALAESEVEFSDRALPLVAKWPIEVTTRDEQSVETVVEAPAEVRGPIDRREPLGEAVVLVDGQPAGSTLLLAGRAVPAPSAVERVGIWLPVPLIALGLLVIVVALLGAHRSRRRARATKATAEEPSQRRTRREEHSR